MGKQDESGLAFETIVALQHDETGENGCLIRFDHFDILFVRHMSDPGGHS